jgi:hypothetical protein
MWGLENKLFDSIVVLKHLYKNKLFVHLLFIVCNHNFYNNCDFIINLNTYTIKNKNFVHYLNIICNYNIDVTNN